MISKVGWTATPVTSYVAKQSPHKRSFFSFAFTALVSMYYRCFSATEGSKSPSYFIRISPSISFHHFGGFPSFSISPAAPRAPHGPVRPCPCWRTTGPQTPLIPTGCGSAWRARSQLIEIRATNHWEYDHWDILGRSLGIFTPISQMISQWYSHTKHFNGTKSWDISMDYWPLTNPVHVQEGPDGLHSMGYVGI